jgi:hypothetical protein
MHVKLLLGVGGSIFWHVTITIDHANSFPLPIFKSAVGKLLFSE